MSEMTQDVETPSGFRPLSGFAEHHAGGKCPPLDHGQRGHFPGSYGQQTPTYLHTPTTTRPAQVWLEGALAAIGAAKGPGCAGKWQCPAHARDGEHSVALSVGTRRDGTGAWVMCHAGCSMHEVLRALNLTAAHLQRPPAVTPAQHVAAWRIPVGFPAPKAGTSGTDAELGYRFEAYHPYGDRFRKERLRHPRTGVKKMKWEVKNDKGEWVPGLLGAREADMPLYRERDIRAAIAMSEPVVLCESESSVDAMKGIYATTWAGGASSPPLETVARVLADYDRVVVIPDNDEAGLKCARILRGVLPRAAFIVSDVKGEDAKDLYRRLGVTEFEATITDAITS